MNELYEKFKRNAMELTILINDLYSFEIEVKHNDYDFNLVYFKIKAQAISAQQSVDEVVDKFNERFRTIEVYGKQLKGFGIKSLDKYVEGVMEACNGFIVWTATCARYDCNVNFDDSWIDDWVELDKTYVELFINMDDSDNRITRPFFNNDWIYNKLINGLVSVKFITIFICFITALKIIV